MKVYFVMHEYYCSLNESFEELLEICATEKLAIEYIKNISISKCYSLNCIWTKEDLRDDFDEERNERIIRVDDYDFDRFYIIEKEVKDS